MAEGSGLPQEVVLPLQRAGRHLVRHHAQAVAGRCAQGDVPYLKSIDNFADLDVRRFRAGRTAAGGVLRARPGLRQGAELERQPVGVERHRPGVPHRRRQSRHGRRTVARRIGHHHRGRDAGLPAQGDPAGTKARARRSAPPTSPTPSWAPGGSPTRRCGCAFPHRVPRATCRSEPRPVPSATPPRIPARRSSTIGKPWQVRCDHHRYSARRRSATLRPRRRSQAFPARALGLAASPGAPGIGGRRGRPLAAADRQRRAAWACGSTRCPPSPKSLRPW